MKRTHFLASFLLALVTSLHATPLGTAFNYQGRLSDSKGAVSGLYDLQFSLWNAQTSGAQSGGFVAANSVYVTNGLFCVDLDFGASVFDGNACWLQIGIRTNGAASFTMLAPRQSLLASPYARYAAHSATANTATTAAAANSVANNVIIAANVQADQIVKSIDGLHDQVSINAGTNVTLRTNGNSLTFSAGPWNPVNGSNTWFTGGKVGIGRAPVYGALDVFDGTGSHGSGANLHLGSISGDGDPKLIHFGDLQSNGRAYVYLGENGQDDTMELRAGRFYFNAGFVGILKTNPASALDVAGNVTATRFVGDGSGLTALRVNSLSLEENGRFNMHDIFLREGSDQFHGLGWYGASKEFGGVDVDGPVLYGYSGGRLGTTGSGATNLALRWKTGGNVIIDPKNLNAGEVTPGLTFGDNSGEGIASRRVSGANQYGLDFYTVYQPRLSIANNGNVGIGTTAPSVPLEVNGTVKAAKFQGQGALGWQVVNSATQAEANSGYLVNHGGLVTVTLPASPALGDIVRISGVGLGGWKLAQNAGQSIMSATAAVAPPGVYWIQEATSQSWWAIASSADGMKLVACAYGNFLFTSPDGGTNWIPRWPGVNPNTHNWIGVASSANGNLLTAIEYGGNNHIYSSSDSGATWTERTGVSATWAGVACSADGSRIYAAAASGSLYASIDYGASWSLRAGANTVGATIASSADGTKLVTAMSGGRIYTSTDSGVNWTARATAASWASVATSTDGMKLVAAVYGGALYTSTDSGATWTARGTAKNWETVASSSDGTKLAAIASDGAVFVSGDSGVAWTSRGSAGNHGWSLASSADGSRLVAGNGGSAGNGNLYISNVERPSGIGTTTGTSGGLIGTSGSAIELQCVGSAFMPLSSIGRIYAY